jgi:triosephosphate isomerase (TIM)
MKRTPLVVANWKMHGQLEWIESYIHELVKALDRPGQCEIVLCSPFVYLPQLKGLLRGTRLGSGAQNLHDSELGAFTGEVSAPMLKEFGCSHVVVGHSERRRLFGETDAMVASKFAAARRSSLIPILCVGENESERDAGITERVVRRQLDAVLQLCGMDAFAGAVIAYEPVWAIGTGVTATPDQAQAVHGFIRSYVASKSGASAGSLRILYGGSVKAGNAAELAQEQDVDGALVGGASLVVKDFLAICAGFNN